jgi:hypothetical protein
VTLRLTAPTAPLGMAPAGTGPAARVERRRLARQDRLAARLGELHRLGGLLADAVDVVERGWVQHAWFRYRDEVGRTRLATAYDLHLMAGRPVVGACLVGAVVEAGGGVPAAGSQIVSRALDLTWHVLREDPGRRVRWCPSPAERAVQVRDLTSWNDARDRRAGDVADLLLTTSGAARAELRRLRDADLVS